MVKSISLLLFCSLFFRAECSPAAPEITSPAVLKRTLDNDPAFRGYTSTLGSWSPLYCNGDYTYSDFGNIADCCTLEGVCHPATDCGTDSEGSTRAIMYQGGDTLTCLDTTCGTQTVYKTKGDPKPVSIYGCFGAGKLYLTTPGSPAAASTGSPAAASSSEQTLPAMSSSSYPSSTVAPVPANTPTSQVGIIAGGAAVGVVLLLAVGCLIAWVVILKKRNANAKSSPGTELQKMQGQGAGAADEPPTDFKAELPTKEGWAAELSPESAPPSRHEQKPWSNLNTPQSPAYSYNSAPPYQATVSPLTPAGGTGVNPFADGAGGHNAGMAEFPGSTTHYQELPGSTIPPYAELR